MFSISIIPGKWQFHPGRITGGTINRKGSPACRCSIGQYLPVCPELTKVGEIVTVGDSENTFFNILKFYKNRLCRFFYLVNLGLN